MILATVIARKEIRDHLRDTRSLLSSALLALMGPGVVFLVALSGQTQGPHRDMVLLAMLSVFALVSSFSGAVDVAMDATAGERERRSLLPLLLNPVSAREVVIGKWIAVAAFAVAAVGVNILGSMVVLSSAAPLVLGSRAPQLLLWIMLGLIPLALFGAAMSVLVAILCRTTKEANTALRVLVFIPMVIGMFLVFFPAWVDRLWFLPIVGQQALAQVSEPSVALVHGVIVAVVTTCAVVGPLVGATHALNRADVLSA